ncbi:MAG: SagB/ThcOx family dehydrogenase [Acidobacteria bacterium]|nr:SagB/ThcOx family dehydrogenase [Acidobacteriota bacterium]
MKKPDPESAPLIGLLFQEGTKYHRDAFPVSQLDYLTYSGPFKEYPDAKVVRPLNPQPPDAPGNLWVLLAQRRSRRAYTGEKIAFRTLESLLWATQGVTARPGGYLLRTAPSAGALYPVESYVLAHAVDDIDPGLYHLNVRRWQLEQIRAGDLAVEFARAALDQGMVARAAATVVWTADIGRCARKYGQRAYRYIYLDAAHIAAHLYLAAEALNLGCCGIAALYDEEVNDLVGIDGVNETVVYMATVGPTRD